MIADNKMLTFQQMATLVVACILLAGHVCQGAPALVEASPDEPQIIGIIFPSEQSSVLRATQAIQPEQQLQLQLQRHPYQHYQQQQQQQQQQKQRQPNYISEDYQSRPDSVKRTFLLKGLRPAQKATGPKSSSSSARDDFVASVWENTKNLRAPSARARMQMMSTAGLPYQQYNGFVDGTSGAGQALNNNNNRDSSPDHNYNKRLQYQQQQQPQQPLPLPFQLHRHRAGTEEVALHMPIHSQSTSDYGWKRVESSRWNNLRGMWGKRASALISDDNSGNNYEHELDGHDHTNQDKLVEKFRQQDLESETDG